MAFTLQIDNAAYRQFRKLSKSAKEIIIEQAETLKTNPMAGEQLKEKYRYLRSLHFSFKGTAYRIIYQVLPKTAMIVIRLASTRENIYRRLEEMNIKPISA